MLLQKPIHGICTPSSRFPLSYFYIIVSKFCYHTLFFFEKSCYHILAHINYEDRTILIS